MMQKKSGCFYGAAGGSVKASIVRLASEASLEITAAEVKDLGTARELIAPGTRVFVTFLPNQSWAETENACRRVRAAGFVPIPHIPVRMLRDELELDRVFGNLVGSGVTDEVLLIAGDYPRPQGPYSCVEAVLKTGVLETIGVKRVSFAGHPEGHPSVAVEEIRRAEKSKALYGAATGIGVTFVTQFCFEAGPLLRWAMELRSAGVQTRLVAGLAGPTRLVSLLKIALRCGIGSSVRALDSSSPFSTKLLRRHGPEIVMRNLAEALGSGAADFSGVHLFSLGGFLATCRWLHRLTNAQFALDPEGGFNVAPSRCPAAHAGALRRCSDPAVTTT